jgi:hypothetical protein
MGGQGRFLQTAKRAYPACLDEFGVWEGLHAGRVKRSAWFGVVGRCFAPKRTPHLNRNDDTTNASDEIAGGVSAAKLIDVKSAIPEQDR